MDHEKLADLLFPEIDKTPEDYENIYPPRELPEGAKVTRLGPSPTGFMHLGNLYGAFVDERLAHQSGGVFYLRIEDTDDKRYVEGAVDVIIDSLEYFGIAFDEGAAKDGEHGAYGPYTQSERGEIYRAMAKYLVKNGAAYPCFMTEEEIASMRETQQKAQAAPGVYGEYAKCRDLSYDDVKERIDAGQSWVLRLRSDGDPDEPAEIKVKDAIRGMLTMPENCQDVVILKANGIPTYHFAHVVDDHLMRTTHVVRGEEWLSTLPIHVELFSKMGWRRPVYCHTAQLMKLDENGNKRKLSKRKDPELRLGYYKEMGYHPAAVREYLLTLLNSNYEEWRASHPDADIDDFPFTTKKMSTSGALFDINKLNDVSKDTLVKISAEDLFAFMLEWAEEYDPETASILRGRESYVGPILDLGRSGKKPRKDFVNAPQMFDYISYFFDERFEIRDEAPEEVRGDEKAILEKYLETYDQSDDQNDWFGKIRGIAESLGYAARPKDFKKEPDRYKGHVGHVSQVIRIAVTGRAQSPDIWEIQQILGEKRVRERVRAFADSFE
ncbi:MAG: glutamate--tRNA ligase [Anaerovoracaceae bacterium]|nr:glutamate--tRNA ligase [Anaerovoracaceae bacterium]